MDSPALKWLRSGWKPENLFNGSRHELIQEMKAWVQRRKLKNQVHGKLREDALNDQEYLTALQHQPGPVQRKRAQLHDTMARVMERANRSQKLEEEKEAETLHGQFLVATVIRRGLLGSKLTSIKPEEVDACICFILELLDKTFNGRKERDILAEREARAKWEAGVAARDAKHAKKLRKTPIPGVKPRAIGVVAAQARQEITKNPTLSMAQAMAIASDMHLGEGVMDMAMGRATPDTIAQMLERIRVAELPSSSTTAGTTAATNSTTASPSPSAANAVTASGTAATNNIPEQRQDQSTQPTKSKAKKKNDARKARKKANKDPVNTEDASGALNEEDEGDSNVEVAGND